MVEDVAELLDAADRIELKVSVELCRPSLGACRWLGLRRIASRRWLGPCCVSAVVSFLGDGGTRLG